MASLINRNGRYYAQFFDADRKPKRKRFSLKTTRKDEARRKLVELEDAFQSGNWNPWHDTPKSLESEPLEPQTIKSALALFVRRYRELGRSENTIRSYRGVIGLLGKKVGSETCLDALKSSQIEAFVRDDEVSQMTRHNRYRHVRAFLNWCEKERLIQANPVVEIEAPHKPEKLPKAITLDELATLCETIKKEYAAKLEAGDCREGEVIWLEPLVRFAFFTGMRSSELARLRWSHIDFEKRLIYIRKQKNKKEQTIPLSTKAKEVLQDVRRKDDTDYVFASPRVSGEDRSTRRFVEHVSRSFKEMREEAELGEHLTLHSCRHGLASYLCEKGVHVTVVKELLRHADLSTTLRYVHMTGNHLRDAVNEAFA